MIVRVTSIKVGIAGITSVRTTMLLRPDKGVFCYMFPVIIYLSCNIKNDDRRSKVPL